MNLLHLFQFDHIENGVHLLIVDIKQLNSNLRFYLFGS